MLSRTSLSKTKPLTIKRARERSSAFFYKLGYLYTNYSIKHCILYSQKQLIVNTDIMIVI